VELTAFPQTPDLDKRYVAQRRGRGEWNARKEKKKKIKAKMVKKKG